MPESIERDYMVNNILENLVFNRAQWHHIILVAILPSENVR